MYIEEVFKFFFCFFNLEVFFKRNIIMIYILFFFNQFKSCIIVILKGNEIDNSLKYMRIYVFYIFKMYIYSKY